jgi:ferredoxin
MSKQTECKTVLQPSVQFVDSAGRVQDSAMCEPQLNLLAHAQAIELDIGSQCGGHGICGGDRIRILGSPDHSALLSPPSESEIEHLSAEELAQGWRLACQCFPNKPDKNIRILISKRI